MSIRIEFLDIAFATLAILGIITDLCWRKLPNWLTLGGLCVALLWGFLQSGWQGGGVALLGAAVAFALFVGMYAFGFMGAGDVKYLMAFGAFGGVGFIIEVSLFSILFGGGIALALVIAHGRFKRIFTEIKAFFLSFLIPGSRVLWPRLDSNFRMPFGVPIALAAAWIHWGGRL